MHLVSKNPGAFEQPLHVGITCKIVQFSRTVLVGRRFRSEKDLLSPIMRPALIDCVAECSDIPHRVDSNLFSSTFCSEHLSHLVVGGCLVVRSLLPLLSLTRLHRRSSLQSSRHDDDCNARISTLIDHQRRQDDWHVARDIAAGAS